VIAQWHDYPNNMRKTERPLVDIEIIRAAPDQDSVLANLLELYAHDFSEFLEIELGEDGRFGYKHLPLYWRDPGRHAFLVRIHEKLAGFVLVQSGPAISGNSVVWDMAEFFIVRRYRRRGIGTDIAHQVWKRFPGRWEVRVMNSNEPARNFWERAISAFTGEPPQPVRVEKDGACWHLYAFDSSAQCNPSPSELKVL
jgi:predicted acetyltransferase